ncbi:dTMP kinase [Lacticaseibacillus zeae]|uniref:Thymidylate kinase n=1 Tax=Lacticaseibacillus zeae subsp. silagei TaxID=3068307 RepID=A0ABD7Z7A2_LACZE|nr:MULTISPECIES: dTMP kinase [Lacticaseibacillus]MDE3315930.1 dTMP kinase [Lacticaseibacillus zeae]OFR94631.1 dTMP kinase [Lactobacillus sp. HMSC068F07]WLV82977.1 dTMP kinase [Lacticaseibacillus sp. NCIMB 15475]WLV85725.1 dTMP kinase [Lacticaseibacillus sp. NCIMB 15474]
MTGTFITFEGPDGAGKTSVLQALIPRLKAQSQVALNLTREPGGAKISEKIRDVILDPANTEMDARTEALLYAASRRQHLVEVIKPALAQGDIVICDRFVDSSVAYQGGGRQIGTQAVLQMNQFATAGLEPDLTIYLDVPVQVGLDRIAAHQHERQYDRLDQESLAFHERVHSAYMKLVADNPMRIVTVDATQPLGSVVTAAEAAITKRFPSLFG